MCDPELIVHFSMIPVNGCYGVCLSRVTVAMADACFDTYRDEILFREVTEKSCL